MAKKEEKSSGGCLSSIFMIIILVVILGGCSACMHGGSDDSSDSSSKTTKVSKKKKPKKLTKAQREAKEERARNEKLHVKQLKSALAKLPDKTENEITDAKLNSETGAIEITLSDATVSGTPAEVKKNTHNAWLIGNQLYKEYAPYTSDYDGQIVDVFDSNDNLLGKTSAWTGEYKFTGKLD